MKSRLCCHSLWASGDRMWLTICIADMPCRSRTYSHNQLGGDTLVSVICPLKAAQ